jgi:hypothetical protein
MTTSESSYTAITLAAALAAPLASAAIASAGVDCDGDGIDDALQTFTWRAAAPSPWSDPQSWFSIDGGIPGPTDLAVFDADSGAGLPPYTVFLTDDTPVRGLNVPAGETTIDLNERVLDVLGDLEACRELLIGNDAFSSLSVLGPGLLRTSLVRVGGDPDAQGLLRLDGATGRPQWRHIAQTPAILGDRGRGTLEIGAADLVHSGPLILGRRQGSAGEIAAYADAQILLGAELPSRVVIGGAGEGLVKLAGGSTLAGLIPSEFILGESESGVGELDIPENAAPQSLVLSSLEIGALGQGLLRIRQGSESVIDIGVRASAGSDRPASGEIRVTTGALWRLVGAPLELAPRGSALLAVGETARVEIPGGVRAFVDGVVGGSGEIEGDVTLFGGEIAPNAVYAVSGGRQQLRISNTLVFNGVNPLTGLPESGRMNFTLGSPDPDDSMSALVGEQASLAGTLRVRTIPGVDPDPDALYPVVEAGELAGFFEGVQSPVLDGELVAIPVYPGDGTAYVRFGPREVGVPEVSDPIVFDVPGLFADGLARDVTADGFPDLIAVRDNGPGEPGSVLVFKNLGVGTQGWLGFSGDADIYPTLGVEPRSVDVGDMNADDLPDLAILNAGSGEQQVRIRLNDSDAPGDFSAVDPRAITVMGVPADLTLADINGDERLDVITVFDRMERGAGGGIQTSENDGGDFDDSDGDTGDDPGSVEAIGDAIDPDGVVATSKERDASYIFGGAGAIAGPARGQGFPLFLSQIVPGGRDPEEVHTADLTGDGLDEVITSDRRSGTISVARAMDFGEIVYADAISLAASGIPEAQPGEIVAVDVNTDGLRDLVYIANDAAGNRGLRLILNLGVEKETGALLFARSVPLPGDAKAASAPVGLAVADLDQDGREDIIALRDADAGGSVSAHLAGAPGPCNGADLAPPFGVLDLSDINAFVAAFVDADPAADLAPPFGVFDLNDLTGFVTLFAGGCP